MIKKTTAHCPKIKMSVSVYSCKLNAILCFRFQFVNLRAYRKATLIYLFGFDYFLGFQKLQIDRQPQQPN
ncbi:hypothetical protein ASG14_13140 [Pedobacter sp. Leaf194]|nr:hypothetical protein ASG14_13140 [Pedobacter sp. Leaf194]